MNLFLTLYLIQDKHQFIPGVIQSPVGYTAFNLDNFSEDLVVNTAVKAVELADKIVLFIEAEPNVP